MVGREEILKLAKFAKLYLDENDIKNMTKDMSEVISFVDTINEVVKDDDIEFDNNSIINAFNEDELVESFSREEVLKNRDGGEKGYFIVKSFQDQDNVERRSYEQN